LGFVCPERTTTTDFLNTMSAGPESRIVRQGYEAQAPKSAEEFERAFRQTQYYHTIMENVAKEKNQESLLGPKANVYSLPLYLQVYECAFRQYRTLVSNWRTRTVEALCIIVQSLVLGTLFRNQNRASKSFFILASSLFYSVLVPALQSMSEFGNTFGQRALVIRQKRYRFYRPMSYALGLVATDAVWKVIVILYNIPLYWLTGFQRTPGHFFIYFLTVYVEHMALSMIFRGIAVFCPSAGRAVLPVGFMFNMFVLYTGLYVPSPQMQVWLFWVKYCNVSFLQYYNDKIPNAPSLFTTPSKPLW
jgi:ATP-binding cassette subfamily G (WHITE) protein 2 (SNQ2)